MDNAIRLEWSSFECLLEFDNELNTLNLFLFNLGDKPLTTF